MILIRSIYITAIGWCLFLLLSIILHNHPDFTNFYQLGMSDDDIFKAVKIPLLIACFGIAYRFIRQEQK